jgi:hypothetical protein
VSAGTGSGAENRRTLFSDRPSADDLTRNGAGASQDTPFRYHSGVDLEMEVRQPQAAGGGTNLLHEAEPTPPHPLGSLEAQLNGNWRVMDDPLQWILQRKKGSPRKKNSGWRNRSFCRTRERLLRCVREHCGEVDNDARAQLQALADYHPDWEPREIAERT